MFKKKLYLMWFLIFSFVAVSCSSVPVSGRKQLNLIPNSQMLSMSFSQYDQFLKEHQISNDQQKVNLVKTVGNNIKTAVESYFKQKNNYEVVEDFRWEFNLVESDEVNAWCMPGGKVVIYEGILPVTQDENGLAVVMGHEIAHAIAEHGNERMSQILVQQLGGVALATALQEQPSQTQQLWMSIYGVGTQVGVLLPYSRTHESEADELGLIFMAMAGYDPNGAVGFWQRMAAQSGGQEPPEFLSTHPSNETRINNIKSYIPEAMKYYKK